MNLDFKGVYVSLDTNEVYKQIDAGGEDVFVYVDEICMDLTAVYTYARRCR